MADFVRQQRNQVPRQVHFLEAFDLVDGPVCFAGFFAGKNGTLEVGPSVRLLAMATSASD
jgi:hypothetical protein